MSTKLCLAAAAEAPLAAPSGLECYWNDGEFDWEGFELHLSCVADSFIEFIAQHYQHLNCTI